MNKNLAEMHNNLVEIVSTQKILPVFFAHSVAQAIEDLGSYEKAGFRALEILCRTPVALESIRVGRKTYPNMQIGAGTVLTPEKVDEAAEAGAQFIVSPAMDPVVSNRARERGLPFIPGVCSPTDVAIGLREGLTLQKLFPTVPMGGIDWINALASPYGHTPLRLIAGHGVVKTNVAEYLKHPLIAAIIADWLVLAQGDALREQLAETPAILASALG